MQTRTVAARRTRQRSEGGKLRSKALEKTSDIQSVIESEKNSDAKIYKKKINVPYVVWKGAPSPSNSSSTKRILPDKKKTNE